MKEEIIKEVAGMTKEGILKSIDILQQEVPELIQQIYRWEFIVGVAGCVAGILITAGTWKLFKYARKNWEDLSYGDKEFPICMGIGVGGLLGPISLIINALKVLKIVIVPKLYLMNYIFGLLKATD